MTARTNLTGPRGGRVPKPHAIASRLRVPPSGDFIDHEIVGDAPQGCALGNRLESTAFEDRRGLRMLDHSLSGKDRARGGEPLYTRRDVYRLAEIILPVVERHGEAGALVDADLEQQVS